MDFATGSLDHSDIVVPDELPHWHIESKGTKSPKLPASKARNWFKQLTTDCPAGKLGVVLHTADAYAPVALLPFEVYKKIALEIGQVQIAAGESFDPAPDLMKMEKGARVYSVMVNKPFSFTGALAFELEPWMVIIAIKGDLWVEWALKMEEKHDITNEAGRAA